jgi:hypothetical protein
MKLTSVSKSIRWRSLSFRESIGLITILSAIQGTIVIQTAQAQAIPAGKPGSVCSDAYLASVMTPEQKQAERDMVRTGAKQMGMCPALFNPDSMTYATLQVGVRPDLDRRLREDKTGTIFFK